MGNNNPNPIPEPSPTPGPIETDLSTPPSKDSKMGLWLIFGVIVVFTAVGGIYWYLSNKQTVETTTAPIPQTTMKSSAPTTTSVNLENDLNSIDASASGSNDFKSVDSDLSGL